MAVIDDADPFDDIFNDRMIVYENGKMVDILDISTMWKATRSTNL